MKMRKAAMSKIGMTPAVEVPDSSIEEQLNALHGSLDMLDDKMGHLRENLSDVLCPVSDKGSNAVIENPIMSIVAERILLAQNRVKEHLLLIDWLNASLNVSEISLTREQN
jgi:hypothetical protein